MSAKITNRYLGDISWSNSSEFDFIGHNKVDVWRSNMNVNLPFLDTFLSIMSFEEIVKARRFYQIKDRNRYIVGRGAIRNILSKYADQPAAAIKFGEGANKKPYLINSNKNKLFHNISYSGDWILLAVSSSAVGADMELVNRHFDFQGIIHQVFNEEEINYINNDLSAEQFFLLWTRKEALVKATGKGLDNDLKLIPCLNGVHPVQMDIISSTDDWQISSFKIDDNHIASVATTPFINEIRFLDLKHNT
jgi:4'-phosphopantetheinyl transferase